MACLPIAWSVSSPSTQSRATEEPPPTPAPATGTEKTTFQNKAFKFKTDLKRTRDQNSCQADHYNEFKFRSGLNVVWITGSLVDMTVCVVIEHLRSGKSIG